MFVAGSPALIGTAEAGKVPRKAAATLQLTTYIEDAKQLNVMLHPSFAAISEIASLASSAVSLSRFVLDYLKKLAH